MNLKASKFLLLGSFILLTISCARAPIKSLDQAMRPAKKPPEQLLDDLDLKSLAESMAANIQHLKKIKTEILKFGPVEMEKEFYIEGLEMLQAALKEDPTGLKFRVLLKRHFEFFEVYGDKDWGEVFITSYFDPVLEASRTKTKKYTQPLYKTPGDLVKVNMGEFAKRLPVFEPFKDKVLEQKSRDAVIRGRLVPAENGDVPMVLPYYDRGELDQAKPPLSKKLILGWVDPIEAFFLHIQGSGVLNFSNKKQLRVGYAAQNGHPYVPIGRYLLDVIPKEEMSLQKIEGHLRSLSPEQSQEILNKNPSYVFFQKLKGKSLTYFGTEVVAGRTIATDYQYLPKGTLAFLEFEKPVFENPEAIEPKEWIKSSRFVIDQDTGGAIRGPHRVDLYWGQGDKAKQVAGVMKNPGRLFYIVPIKRAEGVANVQ